MLARPSPRPTADASSSAAPDWPGLYLFSLRLGISKQSCLEPSYAALPAQQNVHPAVDDDEFQKAGVVTEFLQ